MTFRELMDEFETMVFLQRPGDDWKVALPLVDIPLIETKLQTVGNNWICGFCGRSNSNYSPLCGSCGALPQRALHKGLIRFESWLPGGEFLYSLNSEFTLYINRIDCGRPDMFREEEVVFRLEECEAGPVKAKRVVKGCREEGDTPEMVRLCCDIACNCVFVGAPWRDDEQVPEVAV